MVPTGITGEIEELWHGAGSLGRRDQCTGLNTHKDPPIKDNQSLTRCVQTRELNSHREQHRTGPRLQILTSPVGQEGGGMGGKTPVWGKKSGIWRGLLPSVDGHM